MEVKTRPEGEGRGFCGVCGIETSADHFDEWMSPNWFCPICGDLAPCPRHDAEVSYRIYCPSCCGGVDPADMSRDLYPMFMEDPHQFGCDACLEKIEAVANEDPVFETANKLLLRGGVSPASAVEAAQVIVGEPL